MSRKSEIKGQTKPLWIRNFRNDLHRRLRTVASFYDNNLDEVINDVVERGLKPLEKAAGIEPGKVRVPNP